jgi:gamma-glutamylcyclotransferase (GGCT)/AIG2-like uncharacterized protein YtfP
MVEQGKGLPRVAVYGTLRKGLHNHYLLEDSKYLGEQTIDLKKFRMVSLGGFPAVLPSDSVGATPLTIEVYAVDDDTLSRLDGLEGHPNWYIREKIPTDWKNAWMYVMPPEQGCEENEPVASGDWVDYYTAN